MSPASRELRILMLEDVPSDAEMIERQLRKSKIWYTARRADCKEDFERELRQFDPDVILADYLLPAWDGLSALQAAREVRPETPFIFVSGAIGEEKAVQALRDGATDYVMKDRLQRLGPAVLRAMDEVTARTERLAADRALRQSEERLRVAARATNDVIWDWDIETNLVWTSEAICRLLGEFEAKEYIEPQWWNERLHPQDAENVVTDIRRVIESGGSYWSGEFRLRRADGSYVWVFDRGHVIRDEQGKVIRLVGAIQDITARKQVEARHFMKLSVSRVLAETSRLDEATTALVGAIAEGFNSDLVALWLRDPNSEIYQFESSTSLTSSNLEQSCRTISVRSIVPATVWEERRAAYVAEIPNAEGCSLAGPAVADGFGEGIFIPLTSGKEILGLIAAFGRGFHPPDSHLLNIATELGADIGQFINRKRAEERLKESQASLAEAQRIAHLGNWKFDLARREITGSDEWNRIYGLEGRGPVGYREFLQLVHPEDRARVDQIARQVDEELIEFEHRIARPDGTERIVHGYKRVVFNTQGTPMEVFGTTQDITERKLMEANLEQAKRLSSLGRLAATIAHEFNNVLMGIQPFVDLIRKKAPPDETIQKALEKIGVSIQRGRRVTQEVLRFTRPAEVALQEMDLGSWLNDLVPEMRTMVGERISIRIVLPAEPLKLPADPFQLAQVLSNLVINARDAMPGGGTITITAEPPSSRSVYPFGLVTDPQQLIHVSVQDTGTGIDSETLPHIFEPLFTTKKAGGTGLGLAVSWQIVEKHGGQIFVESSPGTGTTFHLFLPSSQSLAAARPRQRSLDQRIKPQRVLLAEDDPMIASGIATLLEQEGIEVRVTGQGRSVVEMIPQFRPDAVVLDIGLPDVDGMDLYRLEISRRWPHLPVIFSTGHGDRQTLQDDFERLNVGFLQKPYDLEVLLNELSRLMRASSPGGRSPT